MYRIGAMDSQSGVKVHFASNVDIAIEVFGDLESRYGEMKMDETDGNECMWDPGGIMVENDEVFDFYLSTNIVVMCRAQHFTFFADHIQKYEPRGDAVQYIKIHGKYFCICISLDEFEQLKKFVCNAELVIKANESVAKSEEKIDKLFKSGHVVKVIKGEDGKLYELAPAPSDDPHPSKLLN